MRQCVFYDLLLGRYSMKELSESDDIWATIAPGSAARAQKFLTRQADDTVTASIITCREAYTALSGQWAGLIDEMALITGRQLYPRQTEALAKAKARGIPRNGETPEYVRAVLDRWRAIAALR